MNDKIRAWIAPLYAEAKKQELELSAEIALATKRPEGKTYAPTNWELFGQLLIKRLGWEHSYPNTPQELANSKNNSKA